MRDALRRFVRRTSDALQRLLERRPRLEACLLGLPWVVVGLIVVLLVLAPGVAANWPPEARTVAKGDSLAGFPVHGSRWTVARCDPAVLRRWVERRPWLFGHHWKQGPVPEAIAKYARLQWFGRAPNDPEVAPLLSSDRVWYEAVPLRSGETAFWSGELTVVDVEGGMIWYAHWSD